MKVKNLIKEFLASNEVQGIINYEGLEGAKKLVGLVLSDANGDYIFGFLRAYKYDKNADTSGFCRNLRSSLWQYRNLDKDEREQKQELFHANESISSMRSDIKELIKFRQA